MVESTSSATAARAGETVHQADRERAYLGTIKTDDSTPHWTAAIGALSLRVSCLGVHGRATAPPEAHDDLLHQPAEVEETKQDSMSPTLNSMDRPIARRNDTPQQDDETADGQRGIVQRVGRVPKPLRSMLRPGDRACLVTIVEMAPTWSGIGPRAKRHTSQPLHAEWRASFCREKLCASAQSKQRPPNRNCPCKDGHEAGRRYGKPAFGPWSINLQSAIKRRA